MSVWNKFLAAPVSREAGSVIYKGDKRSHKGKMGVFNQAAWDEWERNHTRFQKIHFYWVTGDIKKLLSAPNGSCRDGFSVFLIEWKMILREVSGHIQIASKWKHKFRETEASMMMVMIMVVMMLVIILLVVEEEEIQEKGVGDDDVELILLFWLNKQLGHHALYDVHTNNWNSAKEVWMGRRSWAKIPWLMMLSQWWSSVSLVSLVGHRIQPGRETPAVLPITGVHPKSFALFCLPWTDIVWELTAKVVVWSSGILLWNPEASPVCVRIIKI